MIKFKLKNIAGRYGWNLKQLTPVLDLVRDFQKYRMKETKVWLAGGALRRTVIKQDIVGESDYDFFFASGKGFEDFQKHLENCGFKVNRQNDQNVELLGTVDFNPPVPLDDPNQQKPDPKQVRIQLIKVQYYDAIEHVLSSFDFTLCQFGLELGATEDDDELTCADTALFDVANKRIVVNKITYPVASMRRIIKYTQQGFYACEGCLTEFLDLVQKATPVINQPIRYFD